MATADYQTMLKKVQETDYHTSVEEQREVERAGWEINFPPSNIFMAQANTEIDSAPASL